MENRKEYHMPLFSTPYKPPTFLKVGSSLQNQLKALKTALPNFSAPVQQQIMADIKILEAGIVGEEKITYELKNSHIPMYVLHDVSFEHQGLTAQIDYIVFTNLCIFVLECKNLYGTIEVNNRGEFTRIVYDSNGRYHKEGIYSPITQNQRHLELMRDIKMSNRNSIFGNKSANDYFNIVFIPVVVLANDKTVLNARYAPTQIKNQIVKADGLVEFIKNVNANTHRVEYSTDKEMYDAAMSWLDIHKNLPVDYLDKYNKMEQDLKLVSTSSQPSNAVDKTLACPKCGAPMVRRIAKTGFNAGKSFYGCSRYPNCNGIINEIPKQSTSPQIIQKQVIQQSAQNTNQYNQQPQQTQAVLCPKCGAPMVKRIAKSGYTPGHAFYGCSRYPDCRGVRNIR